MLIVTLALIITGYVLTVILSGNQSQISKYGEGGEINHTKFFLITKKEAMSLLDCIEMIQICISIQLKK